MGKQQVNTSKGNITINTNNVWDRIVALESGVPKADLDDIKSQLNQKASQTDVSRYEQNDYVELLKRYANYTKMQLKKIDTLNSIEVSVLNADRHITFAFLNLGSGYGEYITQSYVYTGTYSTALQAYLTKYWADLVTTGTWTASTSSINGYTSQVGATFTVNISVAKDGDSIAFTSNVNNQGGLWKLTINDDPSTAINVSTYQSASGKRTTEIASQVKKGTYKVTGTFIGDDPANVPSGGAGTGRGWVNTTPNPIITSNDRFANISKDKTLNTPSNKDFAINIKPVGGTTQYLVPYHGTKTDFNVTAPVYMDTDKVVDIAGMANGAYKAIDSFCLSQHIYGRNPESGDTNLIEIWSNQFITNKGMYSFDAKVKVLQPITINNSYAAMGVAKGDIFDTLLSSIGNQYLALSTQRNTNIPLVPERDWAKNYVFLSSTQKDLAIAFRYNNIKDTLRQGQFGKDADPQYMAYLQNRDENILKVYNRLFNSTNLQTGYIMKFSGDYIYSVVAGIYDILSS